MATVIYFSRIGENLIHGEKQFLLKGNTAQVGEKIAQKLQVPSYEIKPIVDFPLSYDEAVIQAKMERDKQSFPEYQAFPTELRIDKHLFIGFPNWCGSFPRVIASVLTRELGTGTVIYPFCTHEGSGMGNSMKELQRLCPASIVKEGLPIRGSRIEKSELAITHWLTHYYWNK